MQTSIVTENRSEVSWGRRQEGGITQRYKETFGGDEHVHYLNCVDDFPRHTYVKMLNCFNLFSLLYVDDTSINFFLKGI